MYQLTERFTANESRLLGLLVELGDCRRTTYLTPATLGALGQASSASRHESSVAWIAREVGDSDTGLAIFFAEDRVLAVVPPFPISADGTQDGPNDAPLRDLLERDRLVGVVLLRLGRYAVGVLRRGRLVASKTGTRHVKRRHKAGGTSQRRFERSRERLVREFFDKACEVAGQVFGPYDRRMDHVLLGGERNTLRDFTRRCRYLIDLGDKTLTRTLRVDRPGLRSLEKISPQVWESRVFVFEASVQEPGDR